MLMYGFLFGSCCSCCCADTSAQTSVGSVWIPPAKNSVDSIQQYMVINSVRLCVWVWVRSNTANICRTWCWKISYLFSKGNRFCRSSPTQPGSSACECVCTDSETYLVMFCAASAMLDAARQRHRHLHMHTMCVCTTSESIDMQSGTCVRACKRACVRGYAALLRAFLNVNKHSLCQYMTHRLNHTFAYISRGFTPSIGSFRSSRKKGCKRTPLSGWDRTCLERVVDSIFRFT